MKHQRLIAAIALAAWSAACAWWAAGRPPEMGERVGIPFSHMVHVADFGMYCDECHVGITEATDLTQSYMPDHTICQDCHDIEGECQSCHPDPDNFEPRQPLGASIGFNHANHIERVEEDCTTCHRDVEESEMAPLADITMNTCLGCHNHEADYAAGRCNSCHPNLDRSPPAAVAEFDHSGDWLARHGALARSEAPACLSCHAESTCAECHSSVAPAAPYRLFPDQVDRGLIHRGDFRSTHPIEARSDPDSCARCHESNFCQECHTEYRLTAEADDPFNPHPANWLDPRNPNFHGAEARRQVGSCAACHDQGPSSNCVDCHFEGRVGGNPHPAGWADDHDLSEVRSDPVCRSCHVPR